MFKDIKVHANFGERTGYQIHASRFFPKLQDLMKPEGASGEVHISLMDVVTASHTTERYPCPSILFNVWESTEYPAQFMENLKLYDQLWVPSEWQRAASIAQGVPEEFVKVVPEGVDPDVYKPIENQEHSDTFNFVHVGQWQPRKSTEEICRAFIKAFPNEKDVRLYLSADTLFPSDNYKSTEERLEAYGINDPRIIPVHFEEREDYIRRLQNAHCFVSCARSEGWGLPIIEALACGIPVIVADWGGSTEYATDCIRVPVKQLIKPFGIYGNWDVPGQWCEPDYDILVDKYRCVFANYTEEKEKALRFSDKIRDKFSWTKAAEKAIVHLEELHSKTKEIKQDIITPDVSKEDIFLYAAKRGFKITSMEKENSVFVIGCWPNTPEKIETLKETIGQVRKFGFPVAISTHYQLPLEIIEKIDYLIYDKKNVLSDDWCSTYFRVGQDGNLETKKSTIPYHGVACLNAMRNAVDFFRGKFDRINYIEYDSEIDLDKFIGEALITDEPFLGISYENRSMRTDVWSGKTEWLDKHIPVINSWAEYIEGMKDINIDFVLEDWLFKRLPKIKLIDLPVHNRFDQVDRNLWDTDVFRLSFFDGAYMYIEGISTKSYDVVFKAGEEVVYSLKQSCSMFSRPEAKYYVPWDVTVYHEGVEKFRHKFDVTGKRVLIQMGSKALGDTLAWMPYVEEFRKKHNCHVVCSGWWQEIFDYPEIEFVKPGSEVKDIYAGYTVGCFDNQLDKNPINWRLVPLQKVASDILGLEYKPLQAKLKAQPAGVFSDKPYVCFSEYSTMQNKMWNRPGAWQKIVDYLVSLGYDCVSVSVEPTFLNNVIKHNGQSIQKTIEDIRGCEFYIGLNHGPIWIAQALGIPNILITGVAEEWNDYPNPYRIAINHDVCGTGCFNTLDYPISRDWHWCPRNKDYACTRDITEDMVQEVINRVIKDLKKPVVVSKSRGKKNTKKQHQKVLSSYHDALSV